MDEEFRWQAEQAIALAGALGEETTLGFRDVILAVQPDSTAEQLWISFIKKAIDREPHKCTTCDKPVDQKGRCNNCWEVERRLTEYLKSAAGRRFVRSELADAEVNKADETLAQLTKPTK